MALNHLTSQNKMRIFWSEFEMWLPNTNHENDQLPMVMVLYRKKNTAYLTNMDRAWQRMSSDDRKCMYNFFFYKMLHVHGPKRIKGCLRGLKVATQLAAPDLVLRRIAACRAAWNEVVSPQRLQSRLNVIIP